MRAAILINIAEAMAHDMVTEAHAMGLTAHELLMVSTMSQRMLQSTLVDDPAAAFRAVQEADATYTALSTHLEPN